MGIVIINQGWTDNLGDSVEFYLILSLTDI